MQSIRSGMPGGAWSPPRRTWVNTLIILNVAIFVIEWLVNLRLPGWFDSMFALSSGGLERGRYWQLLSYMFLHGGVIHLLVNCIGLHFAGREVETVLGQRNFLWIYFLGGLVGGIAQLVFSTGPTALVGASAGVCAVLLAFTTMLPEMEITALLYFIIPIRMKAKWLGRAVILISIFFIATGTGKGVGHLAHLGGALCGWFYTRRIGYGGPFRFQEYLDQRRQQRDRIDRMEPTEFISEEIDPILDKISREGIHSLTRAERRVLEKGREKIERKTGSR